MRISSISQLQADLDVPSEEISVRDERRRLDLTKKISFRQAASEIPPELDMVLPGLQAGKVGVIGGAGASSKTMLALQIGISVAAGSDLFEIFKGSGPAKITAGKVVYLSLEDDKHALWIRQHAISTEIERGIRNGSMLNPAPETSAVFGPDPEDELLDRIETAINLVDRHLEVVDLYGQGLTFASKENGRVSACEEDIEQLLPLLRGARLVVVDTLNRAASAGSLDENAAGEMGALLVALERICVEIGCAIVVLHHINKGGLSDTESETLTQDILRGSSVIVDNARWVMLLRVMAESQAKARFGGDWEAERTYWVRREVVKQNFGLPLAGSWLRRAAGGVLNAFSAPPPKPLPNKKGRISLETAE